MTTKKDSYAIENAKGHAESIIKLYEAHLLLDDDDAEKVEIEGETFADPDEIRELACVRALSVEVRSDWSAAGTVLEPTEYRIVLTFGGPSLQLVGDLDAYRCPAGTPRLEHQDWFTGWSEYRPDHELWDEAADWFASCFYFGV